jgi:hypothetical protein
MLEAGGRAVTEAEWTAATDPAPMFATVKDRKADRKLRLFAVACCRRLVSLRDDEIAQNALAVAELFADGLAPKARRRGAYKSALKGAIGQPVVAFALRGLARDAAGEASETAAFKAAQIAYRHFQEPPTGAGAEREAVRRSEHVKERGTQAQLFRDIFGNPFRPVTFSPSWRTDTAMSLARTMYESREFSAMPILADAIEDAGCDSEDILNHCRAQVEHVRGCWVVDLLLGKE